MATQFSRTDLVAQTQKRERERERDEDMYNYTYLHMYVYIYICVQESFPDFADKTYLASVEQRVSTPDNRLLDRKAFVCSEAEKKAH